MLNEFAEHWNKLWLADSHHERVIAQTALLSWMISHREFVDSLIYTQMQRIDDGTGLD